MGHLVAIPGVDALQRHNRTPPREKNISSRDGIDKPMRHGILLLERP